jgi:hypothetical protein
LCGRNCPAAKNLKNACRAPIHPSAQEQTLVLDMGSMFENDDLNLIDLLERCENDAELVVDVLDSFYLQGSRSCSMLMHALEMRQLNQIIVHSVSLTANFSKWPTHY